MKKEPLRCYPILLWTRNGAKVSYFGLESSAAPSQLVSIAFSTCVKSVLNLCETVWKSECRSQTDLRQHRPPKLNRILVVIMKNTFVMTCDYPGPVRSPQKLRSCTEKSLVGYSECSSLFEIRIAVRKYYVMKPPKIVRSNIVIKRITVSLSSISLLSTPPAAFRPVLNLC